MFLLDLYLSLCFVFLDTLARDSPIQTAHERMQTFGGGHQLPSSVNVFCVGRPIHLLFCASSVLVLYAHGRISPLCGPSDFWSEAVVANRHENPALRAGS